MIPIQKVAKQTRITVRTLRYYDHIGLLKPAATTEGRHRLYAEEDLKKLQQIQFLKEVGYSLKEIKEMLADPKWNWSNGLKKQLAFIMEEQARLKNMENALRELLSSLVIEGGDDQQALQKLIHLSQQDKGRLRMFRENLFDDKERELLAKVPNMSGDDPDSMEWIALVGQLQKHMKDGAASPKVQSILRRMAEKQQEDFAGEDEFIQKLWDARMSASQSEQLGLYPLDRELLQFIEQAYEIYELTFHDGQLPNKNGGVGEA